MHRRINITGFTYAFLLLAALCVSTCITGCSSSSSHSDPERDRVKILHMNDVHSHLDATELDLLLGGEITRCEVGGMARAAALIAERRATTPNHLVLHAGDAVQGTMYCTLFDGAAEAEVMNAMEFDAMAIGNHEFDNGDLWLADFLARLDTPILSANVSVPAHNPLAGMYKPYVVQKVGDHDIGIIGLTIADKTRASSSPGPEVHFEDEVIAVQRAAEELLAAGVGRIILLSHYGYPHVLSLARQIPGVDVIVDGDSHSLLGDFAPYGLESSASYPIMETNSSGEPVCIVQAWENSKVVGELNVIFAGDSVAECSGTPHLLLGHQFSRMGEDGKQEALTTTQLDSVYAEIAAAPQLTLGEEDPQVAQIIGFYADQLEEMAEQVIGYAPETLPHLRVPDPHHINPKLALGSTLAPFVAQAFYARIPAADLGLINAGAIRTDLHAGDVRFESVYTIMPFTGTLFTLEISGAEIKQTLEDTLENIASGGSSGSFPYAYAIRYSVDATKAFGERITELEFRPRNTEEFIPLEDDRLYTLVTNSFIAAGKDGYATVAHVMQQRGATDTFIDVNQALIDYIQSLTLADMEVTALPIEDHCIKEYVSTPDPTDNL